MNYQIAQPLVNAIMTDAGLGNGSLTGIVQKLADIGLPVVEQAMTNQVEASAAPALEEATV